MDSVKRLVQLMICFILLGSCILANAEEPGFPLFGEAESYGRGVLSAQTHSSAICYGENGNPEITFGVQGGYFYSIDISSGQVKYKNIFSDAYIYCHAQMTGSDGNVYFKTYPETGLKMYNPITKEITLCTDFESDGNSAWQGTATDDGKIFLSTYDSNGGRVFEYDIYEKTTKDLGVMKKEAHYVQGLDITDRYIYAGVGVGKDVQACIRYDRQTGEKKEIFGQMGGGTFYYIIAGNGKIFALQNGAVLVYDEETTELVGRFKNSGKTYMSEVSPVNPSLIYNIYQNSIYEYNMETKEHKRVCEKPIHEAEALGLKGLEWAQLINGDWVLEFHTDFMSHVGYFNPTTGEVSVSKIAEIADAGPAVQSLEVSDEGILYMGGYQTGVSAYDINNKEFIFNLQEFSQSEGIGFMNGKTYFGTYTDAVMFRYDPSKPLNYLGYNYDGQYQPDGNPGMVYDIQDSQDRPFVVKNFGNKLYIGTMCGYGTLGGALVIYEEDESGIPSAKTYRNLIPNQSITGIAYKDGKVYLSSTIRGGLGIAPVETQAKIAVFDEKTKKVIKTIIPEVPEIGTSSKTIGEISFGPDGLLWACSELGGTVFAMNPETFQVVKSVQLNPDKDLGALARPLYLRWGAEGNLYTTAGWNVYVVNPNTMEYQRLMVNSSLMTLDIDGNIWYAKGGGFSKIPVNQWDRLQKILARAKRLNKSAYSSDGWNCLEKSIQQAESLIETDPEEDVIVASRDIVSATSQLYYIGNLIEDYTAHIDYERQSITISGVLKDLSDLNLTLTAVSPMGKYIYFDEFNTNADGTFEKTFAVDPLQKGEYSISISNSIFEKPIIRKIEATDNLIMPQYGVNVNYLTGTIEVNGTLYDAEDKTLTLKVVAPSGEIKYISEITASKFGRYNHRFRVSPFIDGVYTISIYNSSYDHMISKTIDVACPENQFLAESYLNVNESENKIYGGVRISNYHIEEKSITLVTAIYEVSEDGVEQLVKIETQNKIIAKKDYALMELQINGYTNYRIKVFVWEDNLKPILEIKTNNKL